MHSALQYLLAALSLAQLIDAQTYCTTAGCFNNWSCRVCWDATYGDAGGWYCCNSNWYYSGWAWAGYIFFFLLIVSLLMCCFVAAASEPYYYYGPGTVVVTEPVRAKSQPVTATTGQGQVVQGGEYEVQAPPSTTSVLQGQAISYTNPESQPLINHNSRTHI